MASFRSDPYGLNAARGLRGQQFTATFTFNQDEIMRFGCRLALAAAHFLFGETFRDYGYHGELRRFMHSVHANPVNAFSSTNFDPLGFWAISWPKSASVPRPIWQAIMRSLRGAPRLH